MRASDRDRREAVAALAAAFDRGSLSTDTFEERAGRAYAARDVGQLDALMPDVPGPRAAWRSFSRALSRLWWGDPDERILVLPPPSLPDAARGVVIGRAEDCNMVIDDPTVSRRHARLVTRGERWEITDLGSTNGTAVNGWRVDAALVGEGDEITVGATTLVLAP